MPKTTEPTPATKGGRLPTRPPTHAELRQQVARVIWETLPDGCRLTLPFDSLPMDHRAESLAEAEAVLKYLSIQLVFPLWVETMNQDAQAASEVLERVGEMLSGGPLFQLQGGDES